MGGGSYSFENRASRASTSSYYSATSESFASFSESTRLKKLHPTLNPYGVNIRECRDSEDHPAAIAVNLNLDLTGSMGDIPALLLNNGLPSIIDKLFKAGINDPAVVLNGIGDHECDQAPLQVGQFESSDQLLDEMLTNMWHERGGGANAGESYLLAWYHAAKHTDLDCLNKRNQKGILVTIGDEPSLKFIKSNDIHRLYGSADTGGQGVSDISALNMANEKYHILHINMQTSTGATRSTMNYWDSLKNDAPFLEVMQCADYLNIPSMIADFVISRSVVVQSELNNSQNSSPSDPWSKL